MVVRLLLGAGCGQSTPSPAAAATVTGARARALPTSAPCPTITNSPIAAAMPPSASPTAGPGALQPAGSPAPTLITALSALRRFPADYQQALVLYASIDRANDGDGTVRHAYIDPVALATFRKTGAFPAGTVIVMDQFAAQRSAGGQLLHDPPGRLIPDQPQLVAVRVKLAPGQTVAGDQLPASLRNGAWVYATFDPLNRQRDSLDNPVCSACHQLAAGWDYVFSRPDLAAAIQQNMPQLTSCDLPGRQPCRVPGK
jgi:Cytochrome P460